MAAGRDVLGERDGEGGTDGRRAAHIEGPAVGLDDRIAHAQPETGAHAGGLGGEERLEDVREDLRRHAGAGVGHIDDHSRGPLMTRRAVPTVSTRVAERCIAYSAFTTRLSITCCNRWSSPIASGGFASHSACTSMPADCRE